MRSADSRTKAELLEENEQLRSRLEEAEQTLQAIRFGEVDALVVEGPQGDRVFSLTGAEHMYRMIAETMHEAVLTVDLEGTILFCNQRFSDLMKTPINEAIARKVTGFVSRPQEQPLAKLLSDVQEGPVQRRLTLRASDGTSVPVQLSANLIEEDSSTSICLLASDLTEIEASAKSIRVLREHQEALEESEQRYKSLHAELEVRVRERTAELERKNQELQEFAFVTSHDLNEPLRKVQTFGSLLKERSADRLSDQDRDYISRMTGAADRMRELLDALLRYSRVDAKGQEFRPSKLEDVVRDVVKDLEAPIQKIEARVEISQLPIINCDPHQWRQLFQNLIANSLKYYRSEVKPLVRVYGEEKNGHCRIFVEDNGIGFDEKYLDKIFQPFQRLHGRNEYSGTGIGLAICRKIVERHKGTITAKSTPGKGSTFIITLATRQKEK